MTWYYTEFLCEKCPWLRNDFLSAEYTGTSCLQSTPHRLCLFKTPQGVGVPWTFSEASPPFAVPKEAFLPEVSNPVKVCLTFVLPLISL